MMDGRQAGPGTGAPGDDSCPLESCQEIVGVQPSHVGYKPTAVEVLHWKSHCLTKFSENGVLGIPRWLAWTAARKPLIGSAKHL